MQKDRTATKSVRFFYAWQFLITHPFQCSGGARDCIPNKALLATVLPLLAGIEQTRQPNQSVITLKETLSPKPPMNLVDKHRDKSAKPSRRVLCRALLKK
jgi:hypothetical protein